MNKVSKYFIRRERVHEWIAAALEEGATKEPDLAQDHRDE